MDRLVGVLQDLIPDSLNLDEAVKTAFHDIRSSSHGSVAAVRSDDKSEKAGITLSFLWQCMMTIILCFFLISCIQQFSQFYQTMLDGLESDRLRSLLSTRQLRSISASNLRRSPAADLLFSGNRQPGPGSILGLGSDKKYRDAVAKNFASTILTRKEPKYDLVYLSTASMEEEPT